MHFLCLFKLILIIGATNSNITFSVLTAISFGWVWPILSVVTIGNFLHVNVGISVAKFEGSGCKEKVVSIIPMSKICRSCVFSVNKNYFSIKVVCRDLQY